MNLFDIENVKKQLYKLEEQTQKEEFWNKNPKETSEVLSQIKQLKSKLNKYENSENELVNLVELTELANIENDIDVAEDILKSTNKLEKEVEELQLETLLSGKYDKCNAILTLHPGAGGTESQDWAEMLYRMYVRWATQKGYTVK